MYIEGEGAGGKATASSVISDIYEITKESNYKFFSTNLKNIECYDKNNLKRPYYLRLMVKDQPLIHAFQLQICIIIFQLETSSLLYTIKQNNKTLR